ncbi:MAG TPA: site-specific integrase [Gemmataceae bacterium]|jgi:integrase|nr:site-specific integrase [Gemmataceae bacterium]
MATKKKQRRRARGEGAVFFSRSKNCWVWRAVIGFKPNGGVHYREGRARTQAAAIQKQREAERDNRLPDAERVRVGEYLDYWLNDVAKPNVRPSTWDSYERCVRLHLKPVLGGIPLRKLDARQVTKAWAELHKAGVSAGNIRKCSEVFACAMERAALQGEVVSPPTRSAAKPRVIRKAIEVFEDGEVKALLKAAAGHRLEALFVLAATTGARQGELLALEWADVDLEARTLAISRTLDYRAGAFATQPPKSLNGVRIIDLPQLAVDALKNHGDGGELAGPIFTTSNGTYFEKTNFIRKDWKPLVAAAKVPYRKFHTFRHTHASRLLAAGEDPATVARRIGDSIETLMRSYAHWVRSQQRDTAGRIDAIYGPSTGKTKEPANESAGPQGGDKVATGIAA